MKKTTILLLILALSVMCATAFAETRYCSMCAESTTFYAKCSRIRKYNTAYSQHAVANERVCNWYDSYYYTNLACGTCGNTVNSNTVHREAEIHDICGGMRRCPF